LLGQPDSFGIIGRGFPLLEGDRTHRTGGQTVSQTVTVIFPQKFGLAVHHADGTFVAGFGTQAAADTDIFIDLDNFTFHKRFLQFVLDFLIAVYDTNSKKYVGFPTKGGFL
jgi:hypothetical protein